MLPRPAEDELTQVLTLSWREIARSEPSRKARRVSLIADRQPRPRLEPLRDAVYLSCLVREYPDHLMDKQTAHRRFHEQVAGGKSKVMNGSSIILGIQRKSQTHDAQGEDRCRLRPDLVSLDQAGEESLELLGLVLRGHEVTPRLLVKRRWRPSRRLKQRTHICLRNESVFKGIGTPPFCERLVNGGVR